MTNWQQDFGFLLSKITFVCLFEAGDAGTLRITPSECDCGKLHPGEYISTHFTFSLFIHISTPFSFCFLLCLHLHPFYVFFAYISTLFFLFLCFISPSPFFLFFFFARLPSCLLQYPHPKPPQPCCNNSASTKMRPDLKHSLSKPILVLSFPPPHCCSNYPKSSNPPPT